MNCEWIKGFQYRTGHGDKDVEDGRRPVEKGMVYKRCYSGNDPNSDMRQVLTDVKRDPMGYKEQNA